MILPQLKGYEIQEATAKRDRTAGEIDRLMAPVRANADRAPEQAEKIEAAASEILGVDRAEWWVDAVSGQVMIQDMVGRGKTLAQAFGRPSCRIRPA